MASDQPCHVCSDMCERLMAEATAEEDRLRVEHQADLMSALASAASIVDGTKAFIVGKLRENEAQAQCIEAQKLQIHRLYLETIVLKRKVKDLGDARH
jgi:hypothetical protein